MCLLRGAEQGLGAIRGKEWRGGEQHEHSATHRAHQKWTGCVSEEVPMERGNSDGIFGTTKWCSVEEENHPHGKRELWNMLICLKSQNRT